MTMNTDFKTVSQVESWMTLRDYFAAKAMHALITEPPWGEGGAATVHAWSKDFRGNDPCALFAFAAYRMADAMLAVRDAETGANECADAIRAGAKEPSDG